MDHNLCRSSDHRRRNKVEDLLVKGVVDSHGLSVLQLRSLAQLDTGLPDGQLGLRCPDQLHDYRLRLLV